MILPKRDHFPTCAMPGTIFPCGPLYRYTKSIVNLCFQFRNSANFITYTTLNLCSTSWRTVHSPYSCLQTRRFIMIHNLAMLHNNNIYGVCLLHMERATMRICDRDVPIYRYVASCALLVIVARLVAYLRCVAPSHVCMRVTRVTLAYLM